MTNKPKSITLQEFEELAKSFVQGQRKLTEEFYASPATMSEEYLEEFKAFAFKEELEKEQRRKDYEKLKTDYLKLKDEFEPEVVKQEKPICIQDMYGYFYEAVKDVRIDSCEGCAFECNTDACDDACRDYNCRKAGIIWTKVKN